MSSEAVKKRGRPKKAATDPIDVSAEPKKTTGTVRQKSTKATKVSTPPASVKAAMATVKSTPALAASVDRSSTKPNIAPAAKPSPPSPPPAASKPIVAPKPVPTPPKAQLSKTTIVPPTPAPTTTAESLQAKANKTPPPKERTLQNPAAPAKTPSPSPSAPIQPKITPINSKILAQVRDLPSSPNTSAKSAAPAPASKFTKTTSPPAASKSTPPAPARPAAQKSAIPAHTAATSSIPLPAKAPALAPAPQYVTPEGQINKAKPLPSNFNPVARKVTLAIVALPIALVTSWILYQRFVLGEETKQYVRPGMVLVDGEGEKSDGAAAREV